LSTSEVIFSKTYQLIENASDGWISVDLEKSGNSVEGKSKGIEFKNASTPR